MKAVTVDIDYLHLDNTFANSECDFPSKAEAYKTLSNICKTHLDYRIYLFMYNLGKEEAFIGLA